MKAISLWQPWVDLVVFGEKKIETRSWKTSYRDRIAIHATQYKKLPDEVWAAIADAFGYKLETYKGYYDKNGVEFSSLGIVIFGVVLGTVELVDCVPIEQLYGTEYDTPRERALGDWSKGRYGWVMRAPERFKQPVPAKGKQGIWTWDYPNIG